MNKFYSTSIKPALVVMALVLLSALVPIMPWWGFSIPVLLFGIASRKMTQQMPAFTVGLVAGFVAWAGMNLFFDIRDGGIALGKMAVLFGVGKLIVLAASGLVGGLLTGLALYAGRSLVTKNN